MNTKTIEYLRKKNTLRIAGLMSGTSIDGIDVAIADINNHKAKLLHFLTLPYPNSLRKNILDLCRTQTAKIDELCHLNFLLGELFAEAVVKTCNAGNIDLKSIDLIGSHGQTVWHIPQPRTYGKRKILSTLQISEPSVIAQRLGITTVADFRCRDMAAGGEGAPLVPFADLVMFGHQRKNRAVQNIGGIANVTYLPAGGNHQDIIAFDTGPGNMIIDYLTSVISAGKQKHDRHGNLARQGNLHNKLLQYILKELLLNLI